ncbi:hypothetical protein LINGRAHAP2_LOCUS16582 [Linum grandiflorum]
MTQSDHQSPATASSVLLINCVIQIQEQQHIRSCRNRTRSEHLRRSGIQHETIPGMLLSPLRPSPEAMASGKAVVLHCAAAVCWTPVSEGAVANIGRG